MYVQVTAEEQVVEGERGKELNPDHADPPDLFVADVFPVIIFAFDSLEFEAFKLELQGDYNSVDFIQSFLYAAHRTVDHGGHSDVDAVVLSTCFMSLANPTTNRFIIICGYSFCLSGCFN